MRWKSICLAPTALVLCIIWTHGPAWADLCVGNYVETVHRTEAKELEKEPYSNPNNCGSGSNSCWVGTRSYNELVIACNRKRDVKPFGLGPVKDVVALALHRAAGKKLDKRTAKERKFSKNLPPRFVTGDYQYQGKFAKAYGYLLERKKTGVKRNFQDFIAWMSGDESGKPSASHAKHDIKKGRTKE